MDQDSAPYIFKKQKPNCELVQPNHAEDPCKFYNNFPFKAMLVVTFLVALPLFPLEAPEIVTQTLNTGNWELVVQLILVGIAVFYGLFSKKSHDDETENEYLYSNSKFDTNVQSRLLEVSSFFNDEAENHDNLSDENRVQTWNNYQYHSGKPVVVVAKESAIVNSRIVEKPLLLPVRSLKSPVLEPISTTTSPKSISPSQSIISSPRKLSTSSESQAKIDQFDHKIVRGKGFNKSSFSPPPPPPPPPFPSPPIVKKSTLLRSSSIVTDDKGSSNKELRRSIKSVPFELSSYKGKSARPIRPFVGAARARVYAKDNINGKAEGRKEDFFVDKLMDEKHHHASEPTLTEFEGEEKKMSSHEKVVLENDEDSEDCFEEGAENVEVASKKETPMATEGVPDNVDKKADEFIAKFREQIRLQRIQSIRTSAGQPAKKLIQ